MAVFLRRNSNSNRNPNPNCHPNRNPIENDNDNHKKSRRNPIQTTLVYISFCVARKKSENRALGHDL